LTKTSQRWEGEKPIGTDEAESRGQASQEGWVVVEVGEGIEIATVVVVSRSHERGGQKVLAGFIQHQDAWRLRG